MLDYHSIALFADEALRRKEPWSHHGLNVARLSMEVMHYHPNTFTAHQMEMVKFGAWMHDIGKLFLEDALLNLPRRLSINEMQHMQTHPKSGWEFGSALGFDQTILNIIYCHHENDDGSGYPRKLKNGNIPFEAQVVHVVDVFDALTNDRAYRKGESYKDAFEIMEVKMAGSFNLELLATLKNLVLKKLK